MGTLGPTKKYARLLLTCVIIPNFVKLGQTVLAYAGGPKIFWDTGAPPLGTGLAWLADPYKHAPAPHVLPNFVILGQTLWA